MSDPHDKANRGGSRGGHGGQTTPPYRIILGKPKEWCSGIKCHKMHYFLSLASFQYFMRYNLPYLIWGCTHHAPYFNLHYSSLKFSLKIL